MKASTLVTSHVSFSTDTCQDATPVPFVAWCEAGPADSATEITLRITGENFTQYYTGDSTELCFENLCTTASVIRVTTDDAPWNVLPDALHTLKCISTQTIPTEEPRVLEKTGKLQFKKKKIVVHIIPILALLLTLSTKFVSNGIPRLSMTEIIRKLAQSPFQESVCI